MKILLGFSLFLLVSCGSSSSSGGDSATEDNTPLWINEDTSPFINSCREEAEKEISVARANYYCHCVLEEIKKRYTPEEFENTPITIANTLKADGTTEKCAKTAATSVGLNFKRE